MATYTGTLYTRSCYFEIYSKNSEGTAQTLQESYAFTIPPSSISITQKQRVTVTETPGGNFVDNYGIGNATIAINGDTGNQESRLTILGAGKTAQYLTGQNAWFEFQRRIQRYSAKSQDYIMYFYDLTNKASSDIFTNTSNFGAYSEAWEVVLDDSSVNRTSSKPFHYPYNITLIGVRKLGEYNPRGAKNKLGFLSDITTAIDNATASVELLKARVETFLYNAGSYVEDALGIFDSISNFTESIASFSTSFDVYVDQLSGIFSTAISETEDTLTSGLQIVSFPVDALESVKENIDTLVSDTNDMLDSVREAGDSVLDKYDWDNDNDDASQISEYLADVEKYYNEIVLSKKQSASYDPVGAIAIDGVVTSVYGYETYNVKENTRLDRLSNDIFGDPDFKDVISSVNGLYADDELTVGDEILVPIFEPKTRYANNAVYNSESTNTELLGRDIYIDDDGIIQTQGNDYLVTTGEETILQAVQRKLAEKKGRQIRDTSYGILREIGEALDGNAPLSLMKVGLEETLIQDPRITSVNNVDFFIDGDVVYQAFGFDTITKSAVQYKEVL
ncbi:MAG: DUF2634 domain-containing protein [Spirochaetales bacterium]|nr:DUF2634 domain-containing protein [Spirochaetales bacterium]